MYIRRFTIISIVAIFTIAILSILVYQNNLSKAVVKEMVYETETDGRLTRTNDNRIQIYNNRNWEDLFIKGIHISSFTPGYSRNKSSIHKEDVILWLDQISELNANLITIPNIQPASFYNAVYDYNLNNSNPIYIIHEIPLDERAILQHYDAFNSKILNPLMKDISSTIDVVHGRGLILNNSRHHRGIYLKDISAYVLGYIIGTNTNAELVTLTNLSYESITSYEGEYFSMDIGTPFEAFISEIMNFAAKYEVDKYNQLSLFSYLCSIETDPLTHINETNVTKRANINLENITPKYNNLFASYTAHPNSADFIDYEYNDILNEEKNNDLNFYKYLRSINEFHSIPVLISDIGIPSSRGMSRVDIDDGFNRGNHTETQQGTLLVELLESIYKAGSAGAVIYSWQDDWGKSTAFNLMEDYSDKSSSTYWFDTQASDEAFGLVAFPAGDKKSLIVIDGDFSDWENINTSIYENSLELKVTADTSYLYLMIKRPTLSMIEDRIYIGLNISPLSGSNTWEDEVEFPIPVDFIIDLNGYNESRIVVQERYNMFNYLYKYYSNIIDKQDNAPAKDSDIFSAIYLLNRNKFYFREDNTVVSPIYYQTGRLVYGNGNPLSDSYNSLADFNKEGDSLEIRIPWMLINVKNPLKRTIQDDFYSNGIEGQILIKNIGLSVSLKNINEKFTTKAVQYEIPDFKNQKYHQRLKASYKIIKAYWEANQVISR